MASAILSPNTHKLPFPLFHCFFFSETKAKIKLPSSIENYQFKVTAAEVIYLSPNSFRMKGLKEAQFLFKTKNNDACIVKELKDLYLNVFEYPLQKHISRKLVTVLFC